MSCIVELTVKMCLLLKLTIMSIQKERKNKLKKKLIDKKKKHAKKKKMRAKKKKKQPEKKKKGN